MRTALKGLGCLVLVLFGLAAAMWFFLFRAPGPGTPTDPIETASGPVRGLVRDGVSAYLGIPYAAPPVGELRWRAPTAVANWSEPLDAFSFGKACPQLGSTVPGLPPEPTSEDCLFLNVWSPSIEDDGQLPVIIWIHGGSNTNGAASAPPYGGGKLAARGVVVVSLNYRLGALGNLAHPQLTEESGHGSSGNYGLMDIVAALRWVQTNVAAFGGDPDNVTVMGQSAGAWNISHLQVSPFAAGLYHRVIAMSGGEFGPPDTDQGIATLPQAEAAGLRFAKATGADTLAELRSIPAERIVAVPAKEWAATENGSNTMGIIDGYLVPGPTYELNEQGRAHAVDLLVGYTSEEGVNWVPEPVPPAEFQRIVERRYGPFAAEFLALYPASSEAEATRSNRRLEGERAFKWQTATWARLHAATGKGKTWAYRFDHTPGIGPFRYMGPGHGADLGYVFDYPNRALRYGTQWPWRAARDVALIDTVQGYWLNFARTGDPNGAGLPQWPNFAHKAQVMLLDDQPRVVPWPDAAEHRLLDRYMRELREAALRQSSAGASAASSQEGT